MTEDLVLHPQAESSLVDFVRKPAHAVLLHGGQGIGKTHIGRQLASRVLGTDVPIDEYPYALTLQPEKGIIPIESVRQAVGFTSRIVPGKQTIRRILLVEDIDTMTIPAQNAFLKLVEEPPTDTVIIATTSGLHKILPTIRSRMTSLHILAPTPAQVVAFYESRGKAQADIQRAQLIHGANVSALERALNEEGASDDMFADAKTFLGGSQFDRLAQVQVISKDRETAVHFCEALAKIAEVALHSTKQPANITRWHGVLSQAQTAIASLRHMASTKLVLTELATSL